MQVIERGSGPALVVIPGVQGKWQYVRPAVDALARSFRVITFSLCGEPESGLSFDRHRGFYNYVDQVAGVLDRVDTPRAAICGISFGGLIALHFAAAQSARTSALILVSTPGPSWRLRRHHAIYARWPLLFGPLFLAEVPSRLRAELRAAMPNPEDRRRFVKAQLEVVAREPVSLARMADRALGIPSLDVAATAARVTAPTLIVSGDVGLDHVVAGGALEYTRLVSDARAVVLERTGHLGSITQPDLFAGVVGQFLAGVADADVGVTARLKPDDPEAA